MIQKQLKNLIEYRDRVYEKDENSIEVDELATQIIHVIKENFDTLPIDVIIEGYTKLGSAPNLVYDDNGDSLVTCDGYSPVVIADELMEGVINIVVEKAMWKTSIREALKYWVFNED